MEQTFMEQIFKYFKEINIFDQVGVGAGVQVYKREID